MSFVESVGNAIKSGLCANLRLSDNANRFFNELSPIDLPNFSRYWRPKLCDDDPAEVEGVQPPFEGGQCPVSYEAYLEDWAAPGQPGRRFTASALGPFRNYQYEYNQSVANTYIASIEDAGGTVYSLTGTTFGFDARYESLTVLFIRRDGLPDDCGDPDPIPPPPLPPEGIEFTIAPTYINNEGDTVNLNGTVNVFAPVAIFAPVTTIIAPVKVNLGGIVFNGSLELAPEYNFNFGAPPGGNGPGRRTGEGEDEDPITAPPTPEDEGDEKLVGIVVRSQRGEGTQTTELDELNAPDLFVPRIANAYFRTRNDDVLGWYGPIDIKTTSAFVPVPPNVNAVDARVSFQKGWSGSFFKITGLPQS